MDFLNLFKELNFALRGSMTFVVSSQHPRWSLRIHVWDAHKTWPCSNQRNLNSAIRNEAILIPEENVILFLANRCYFQVHNRIASRKQNRSASSRDQLYKVSALACFMLSMEIMTENR